MNISKIDSYLHFITEQCIIPCANISIGTEEDLLFFKSYGNRQLFPFIETANTDTLFDIASLTKVLATWPCIMYLIENSYLKLSTTLDDIWGQAISPSYRSITIQSLLTHTSGISSQTYLKQYGNSYQDIVSGLFTAPLEYRPNTKVIYSNRGFIILGLIIEYLTKQSLNQFAKEKIWLPLGMHHTTFGPLHNQSNIAATEIPAQIQLPLKGIVHDENAQLLEGIAGHAGVFSTLYDISIFCKNLLLTQPKIFKKETLLQSFIDYTPTLNEHRGLGWKILYTNDAQLFFHLGFTGTSIWLDFNNNIYSILLTNRIHPSRENKKITEIRQTIRELIWE